MNFYGFMNFWINMINRINRSISGTIIFKNSAIYPIDTIDHFDLNIHDTLNSYTISTSSTTRFSKLPTGFTRLIDSKLFLMSNLIELLNLLSIVNDLLQ